MTTATAPLSSAAGQEFWQEPLLQSRPKPVPKPVVKAAGEATPPESSAEAVDAPPDISHTWVVAAEIQVEPRIASIADFRGSFKTTAGQRVDALEVYCRGCRRPYDEVKGQDCAEKVDNRHLIGGDQSTRRKRKLPPPPKGAKIIPGQKVQRRGIGAYMAGVSRPR
ncbi:hypothetical protein [Streptomyces cavernicola]|uniref:Uncharacterized protein n=1 Tax=Streptomyces cavernicola TaxID=3043613 RepID=A0ABT6SJQ5_9ACTN|nr:hypothetical protein [Streptomyces sp. B-S-A6]MDI3407663.1 hypothetical protein [Streptomyces sp. B-S-A6]